MRLKRKLLLLFLAFVAAGTGFAFIPGGPYKTWQVPGIGYQLPGDIMGPMGLTEAYRWNVPVITYAFDESFIRYFGTNGIAAVERAIKMLNDVPPSSRIPLVTNISGFFGQNQTNVDFVINGEKVPLDPYGPPNFTAANAGLLDLKSYTLGLLVEHLGLADPERFVWSLRSRVVRNLGGGVVITNYTVLNQNYDPITLKPTNVVNNVAYGWTIEEPLLPGNYADAVEYAKDPTDPFAFSSVAHFVLPSGYYYQRLDRDTVGGLRFLFSTNNLVTETFITPGNGAITRGTGAGAGGLSPWTIVIADTNLVATNFITFSNATATVVGTNLIDQAIRPGIDKITFVRVYFDSLIGQAFSPVTNFYSDVFMTNARVFTQPLQRTITAPDLLFTAEDLGVDAAGVPITFLRPGTGAWVNNDAINGSAVQGGPGVITPTFQIRFTDRFPYFLNVNPGSIDDLTAAGSGAWGSFDGTTNAPIVYPEFLGLSAQDIQSIVRTNITVIRVP